MSIEGVLRCPGNKDRKIIQLFRDQNGKDKSPTNG